MIAVVIFALLFCGCGFFTEEKNDITVINDFNEGAYNVYLDGHFQFRVAPQHSLTIHDVSDGKHLIECGDKFLDYELIQSWGDVYVYGNIEWSIKENFSFSWYSLER